MKHTAVVDLSYGDAGKGTVVDWLCETQPVHAVVRFNGGAQGAHNVVRPDGRHHTFAQFGSGTLAADVETWLSRFCLVEPLGLASEAHHLEQLGVTAPLDRMHVDVAALLTTPFHAAANRAREASRGDARHGSCGIGIGETMAYAIGHPDLAPRVRDIADPAGLRTKLTLLARHVRETHAGSGLRDLPDVEDVIGVYEAFAERVTLVDAADLSRLLRAHPVVFEGAQGVLLDEWRGFHPHTTWSTTTFDNVDVLLGEAGQGRDDVTRMGVLRTYTTRHGAGPLVTEDPALRAALPEAHNGHGDWQGSFRVGHFDVVAHRYALEVCGGVDQVALTHLDRVEGRAPGSVPGPGMVSEYRTRAGTLEQLEPGPFADLDHQEHLTRTLAEATPGPVRTPRDAASWVEAVESALDVEVSMTSDGPTCDDKVRRVKLAA